MSVTKEIIAELKAKHPNSQLALVVLHGKDEKSVELEVVVKSPDRKIIGEAEKWDATNPAKAKEIYVRNCVLTDVERVMALDADHLFYQAYFAIADLLPFQKPDVKML